MVDKQASERIENYFNEIDGKINKAYKLASRARELGFDPEDKVDIPLARNMAERVTGLISSLAPQIIGSGISERIIELETKFGTLDWRVSLVIAEEVANEKFCKFKNKHEAMEIGIRIGFAYHTLGTVASPLEGLTKITIEKNKQGKEYFKIYFSGPIRSAGGTGASVSVLICDYVRKKMGYDTYDPTEKEVKRYVTELYDYHERITNLQYLPSPEEIEFLAKHLPVQIAGDPSEKIEVSNYKDLPRVETNRIRNGVCLTLGEGIAQKAKKLWKQLSKWGHDFDLDQWDFLQEFVDLQKKIKSGKSSKKEDDSVEKSKVVADKTFIKDIVAGRPVLSHSMRPGGFRLRFGKSRTSGYSSCSIHPATMHILNKYLAAGTQIKTERPGKAAVLSCCDSIEGPIVKLKNGNVLKVTSEKQVKEFKDELVEILFLGDILSSYGDFLNRAHVLFPPGYCEEWWIQELEKATVDLFGNLDIDKLSELIEVPREELDLLLKHPLKTRLSADGCILISKKLKIPLHPNYTYHWSGISSDQLLELLVWFEKANIKIMDNRVQKIILPVDDKPKRILELLGIPHSLVNNEFVVIDKQEASAILASLNIKEKTNISHLKNLIAISPGKSSLDIINLFSDVSLRDKSGIFVGARMGRPEKAKMRKLTGSPHVLFPVGDEGGRLKCFQAALEEGKVISEFPLYFCNECNKESIFRVCDKCNTKTIKAYNCNVCGSIPDSECKQHGPARSYKNQSVDIKSLFQSSLQKLGLKTFPDLIKGVRTTSNSGRIPESLAKGILRAKHDIYVNKDGTTRYDMTQMPLTHFKPKEIGTPINKLIELGYNVDIHDKPLVNSDQILEVLPQDIVLPACQDSPDLGADIILFRVANFCDELLKKFYNLPSFYNLKSPTDLIGHIVIALAPHTSAGISGRIIGFSQTQGFLAHPMIHAATRRDCDGDEACVLLALDAFLNFSRQYLPAHRGSKQDAPLVLTSRLRPSEVDDMIFDLEMVFKYPLDFYNACLEYKNPWDVELDTVGKVINTPKQYEGYGFTHDTNNFNAGVNCSAYKTLPSMEEKLKGQMDIAEKVRAVDTSDVARLVIEKHFIRDIKGNLRKFSMQMFRCVKCNEKFRRPPLIGKCTKCGGKIIFTISEGSVVKYLEPSISLASKYNVPKYLIQTLEILKRRIEDVFGKEKEIQEGLGKWFG